MFFLYLESCLPPPDTTIADPNNDARENSVAFCEQQMLEELPKISKNDTDWSRRGVILIQARLSTKKGRDASVLTEKEQDRIRKFRQNRLDAVGNLYAVIGAPYLVRNNVDVPHGVANGTLSTLKNIVLQSHAKIRVVHCGGDRFVHAVYADEVQCFILKHCLGGWKDKTVYSSLPDGCFPLVPTKHSVREKINGTYTSISVCQLQCVSALVLTGHKIQGQSMDSVILGDLQPRFKHGQQGWLYVILSRVRTLKGLYTLVELDLNMSAYKPRLDVMEEMSRLEKIEVETLRQLQSRKNSNVFFLNKI